ncbi:hypothetical protein [Chamaesiphon sp. GL140_3_metabinner_50]|uniref:hypothetical protein n=1 Tax=Chamaesiphon sp. GL140_3_metabinner_50 TaxID=2970812 RepID=UPI0025F12EC0|nr:hypothetical protein [Chamaesiphon sp. GL140_3_metabinner_50]
MAIARHFLSALLTSTSLQTDRIQQDCKQSYAEGIVACNCLECQRWTFERQLQIIAEVEINW